MKKLLLWLALFTFVTVWGSVNALAVSVEISNGQVTGEQKAGVVFFPNIAYAEPPIGPRRWRRSELSRKARQIASPVACGQTVFDSLPGTPLPIQEDCLYLHLWAPANQKKRPVVVMVHGGGLLAGSGLKDFYDGSVFARNGVVFVSFNYRLSELGYGPNLESEPGSLGLLDQALALRWVEQNVEYLGGDPENITIMGHSKGAEAVVALMESGLAGTKVKKGIALSGIRHFDPGHDKFISEAQKKFLPAFHSQDWKTILKAKGFLIYDPLLPRVLTKREDGHQYKLLVSVLYDEKVSGRAEELYCGHAFFLKGFHDYIDAYFYVLHPGSKEHGSEMQGLFNEDRFGKRLMALWLPFFENSTPPPAGLPKKAEPFLPAMKVHHIFPHFAFRAAFEDKWRGTSCTDQKKFPGSSISGTFIWLDRLTSFLGESTYDDAYFERQAQIRPKPGFRPPAK